MKNTLPLILAVLLGLAAVFAVNRTMARSSAQTERTKDVLVANNDINPGSKIESGVVTAKPVPFAAYMKGRHILGSQKDRIEGLKVVNRIAKNSPVLWEDLETKDEGERVGNGEFVVAVRFQSSPLVSQLKAGDEIAIAAMQMVEIKEKAETTNLKISADSRYEQRLTVLFPCETIREVTRDSVFISAPPERALQLIVASENYPLYPLLRRQGDSANRGVAPGGSISATDLSAENIATALP